MTKIGAWPFIKKLTWFGGILFALGFIGVTVLVVWAGKDLPDPTKLSDRQVAQSTKIYDRTGEHLLYEVYKNEKRTLVTLDQISDYAKKATIAVEDKHFYEHKGIRPVSIIRAGFNNLIGRSSGSGGASTLTQQLIKNTMVGGKHSYLRKIKEAILAIKLEQKYDKDQILQMYLNEIPYGSTNYGIEAASQDYFKKGAKDLTLSESATLAALVKAPSQYLNDMNKLRARRDLILGLMKEQGFISEEQKTEAQNVALRLYRNEGMFEAPHFVLYVKQQLADQFGENMIDNGGLKVITTLDYDKQKIAEGSVKQLGDENAKKFKANNAALVAMDPKTGQILSMVGSRGFNNQEIDGQFNVAVLGKRQPGSSFKPFVYLAAFEKGFTPDTVLYDVVTNFDAREGASYTPKNYDNKEHGLVTMRKALQGSLNIPSVKTLYLVGVKNAIDFAKRFGYSTFTGDYGLSLVLGGAEVNLLEHTNGYATLANNGVYHEPASILKITSPSGEILQEWKENDGTEAAKPELVATLTDVLTDDASRAFIFGSRGTLTLPDRPVAAKTGTTNDNKDAWTLGYVPSLAVGVWVGNTIPSPMKGGGNSLAGTIWNKFMREALKNTPPEQFPTPPPNDAEKPVLRGAVGGIKLQINRITGKIAVPSTTPNNLIVERVYLPPHDILYYVNKDDPRGPAPANPADDPQFNSWETALQSWLSRQQETGGDVTIADPPTEYDTAQSIELLPTINIISPAPNSVLNNRNIQIQIQASAPRGIAQVIYYIDNQQIGSSRQFPFGFSYYAQRLEKGPHTLRAMASDDLENSAAAEVVFDLQAEMDAPNIDWTDQPPLFLQTNDFPYTISILPFRWNDIKNIKIFLSSAGSEKKLIYTFDHTDNLLNGKLNFTWNHSPGVGEYQLTATMTDNAGSVIEKVLGVVVQ